MLWVALVRIVVGLSGGLLFGIFDGDTVDAGGILVGIGFGDFGGNAVGPSDGVTVGSFDGIVVGPALDGTIFFSVVVLLLDPLTEKQLVLHLDFMLVYSLVIRYVLKLVVHLN